MVALVWGRGVLVSADSRASSGFVFHEERKIKPIFFVYNDGKELDLGIVGGAGDATLVKQGFSAIESVFRLWFENTGSREDRNPFADEIEDIVAGIEYLLFHPDQLKKKQEIQEKWLAAHSWDSLGERLKAVIS